MTTSTLISRAKRVAFQGEPGAYANLAACEALPHATAVPRPTFDDAVAAVRDGETELAIIPGLAAEIYGLDILKPDVEDEPHNMTRFLIMAHEPDDAPLDSGPVVTTFVFRVRNVPAALYKAMGGFATNGVNMTKLESYQLGGSFNATQFYADIEGHPQEHNVRLALEELRFFTSKLTILGVYPAHPFRARMPFA